MNGLSENIKVAKRGGKVARVARTAYEEETKTSAITSKNTLNYEYISDNNKLENKH